MSPLQVDILRVSLEKMRSVPLLRSQCLDVRSPVAVCVSRSVAHDGRAEDPRASSSLPTKRVLTVSGACLTPHYLLQMARFKRKLTRDRSTYRDIDTSTLDLLLARGANVNSYCGVGSESPSAEVGNPPSRPYLLL